MLTAPSLRELQIHLKSYKRSMRKYMPQIALRTSMSGGMVTHYFNGYGTSVERYTHIIQVCDDIKTLEALRQTQLEKDALAEQSSKKSPSTRKYRKYSTRQTL